MLGWIQITLMCNLVLYVINNVLKTGSDWPIQLTIGDQICPAHPKKSFDIKLPVNRTNQRLNQ